MSLIDKNHERELMSVQRLVFAIGLILLQVLPGFAQDVSIQSLLGVPFGQVCQLGGKFVEKPANYYAQNVSQAEFYLEISEINGRVLPEPLLVEPVCQGFSPEPGKLYQLKAYETIASQNEPENWSDDQLARQFNYSIIHRIVVRQL